MRIEKINTKAIKVMEKIQKNSLVTFGLNEPQFIKIDGEVYTARPISTYNWKIVLNGMKVIINPSFYDGDLNQITVEGDLWVFYNTEKVLLFNNTKQEMVGVVEDDLDPLTHDERVAKYLREK